MASHATRKRLHERQHGEAEAQERSPTSNKIEGEEEEEEEEEEEASSRNGCCTPKGKRFRIPEILTCPPAPKKRRVTPNCLTKRSPIAYFAPPDIELFFFFAFRNISA